MATTRALLLTDLVGSTRLTEQLGDAGAAELSARHDRVARDLLRAHRGLEIDKTDGFLFLFEAAADAAAYAVAYHRALAPLGLQARAGLHVGSVILRETPADDVARGAKPVEVEGVAKPTAARVMALALAGQTLCTAEAAEALELRGSGGPEIEGGPEPVLVAHGHWMLKGLTAPVPLFELAVPGESPMMPPPDAEKAWRVVRRADGWAPVREIPRALLAERDAFVGREEDLAELAGRLEGGARLVTLVGLGGAGKTRLATRYAWVWLGAYPGGAWFCDLAEARSAEGVVAAVARALDVPLGRGDGVDQLGHAIAARGRCLVLLDNFEQVARHADETLGRWLDRALDAQFVVTTREVLGLPGETALALPPLGTAGAVALFEARAAQAKRDFVVGAAERGTIEALVKLLDGLPLAIELAAARVRVMTPHVLLQRMSERFKLLASSGARHTRHATLRSTLDWSWDLLSSDEQRALAQLSVFEGGFALDAAEAVLALDEAWPMDAVQALVDKSLVRRLSDARFDLLVSVREYASDKLDALGLRADAEARHVAWFADLSKEAALRDGGVDFDNLAAACRHAADRGDAHAALRALRRAWEALSLRGPYAAAEPLLARVEALPALGAPERVQLDRLRGNVARQLGRVPEAEGWFRAALAGARALGDQASEGAVHHLLGSTLYELSRFDDALASFDEADRVARALGPEPTSLGALHDRGNVYLAQGRLAEARAASEAALVRERAEGDQRAAAASLANLGLVARAEQRQAEACRLLEEGLASARAVGDRRLEAVTLGNLALTLCDLRRWDEAAACLDAALKLNAEVGFRNQLAHIHLTRAIVAGARDQDVEYTREIAAALAAAREIGARRFEGHIRGFHGRKLVDTGAWADAITHLEEATAIAREVGDGALDGLSSTYLAEARLRCGLGEGLLAFVVGALERAARSRYAGSDAALQGRRASLLALVGRLPEAREALALAGAAIGVASHGNPTFAVALARVEVAWAAGDAAEARAALEEAEACVAAADPGSRPRLRRELERVARLGAAGG